MVIGHALLLVVAGLAPARSAQAALCGYVANEGDDSVSVVDLAAREVVETVAVGDQPSAIAITRTEADGALALVINRADHTLSMLPLDRSMTLPAVPLTEDPAAISASADGTAYIVHPATATLSIVDVARLMGSSQSVPGRPVAVALAGSAPAVLMVDASGDRLLVRDNGDPPLLQMYRVGAMPTAVAVDPSSGLAYVVGSPMAVFDPARGEVTGQLPPPSGTPSGITVNVGLSALVLCSHSATGGTVSIVPTDLSRPRSTIALGATVEPSAIAGDPAGGTLAFVTDRANDRLLFVDLTAGVVGDVATGRQPVALAVVELEGEACWPSAAEPTPTSTPVLGACAGDCNGDVAVAINELIVGVTIALGDASAAQCPALDTDPDGQVVIAELIAAVGAALNGCP